MAASFYVQSSESRVHAVFPDRGPPEGGTPNETSEFDHGWAQMAPDKTLFCSSRGSVQNAIRLAASKGYRSIAFPLIGAGTGDKKVDAVLAIMQDALRSVEYDGEVRIIEYRQSGPTVS